MVTEMRQKGRYIFDLSSGVIDAVRENPEGDRPLAVTCHAL